MRNKILLSLMVLVLVVSFVACPAPPPTPVVKNQLPVITSLSAASPTVTPGGHTTVACVASDPDGDLLTYSWTATGGSISGVGATITWLAPPIAGTFSLAVTVSDGRGGIATASVTVTVTAPPNRLPVITSLTVPSPTVSPGGRTGVTCVASDPDGDPLTYSWTPAAGRIIGEGATVTWEAPTAAGTYSIAVTVSDGRGGVATHSVTVTVTAPPNRPPVITSLTVPSPTVSPGGSTTVTCIASDPDGDLLTYSWAVAAGRIIGEGATVTWEAPAAAGTYSIAVTVSDGRGGVDTRSVTVTVALPVPITVTLLPVPGETGMVYSNGVVACPYATPFAGDTSLNVGARAFFSFNISALAWREIVSATLTFTTTSEGAPFPMPPLGPLGLDVLWIMEVHYGTRPLAAADYHLTGTIFVPALTSPPTTVDATPRLMAYVTEGRPRFQIRAHFALETDGDNRHDYLQFNSVKLTITYR